MKSIPSFKPWFLAASIAIVCSSMLGVARADVAGGSGTINISSFCPPAVCSASWDDLNDPASGSTDFNPAGYPFDFSFVTGDPLTWSCPPGENFCQATYGYGGTFSLTGPEGLLTGVVTSGFAYASSQGFDISVDFLGQWSDGKYAYGDANEVYSEATGFSSQLDAAPAPEPSSLLLFGSGIFSLGGLLHRKRRR